MELVWPLTEILWNTRDHYFYSMITCFYWNEIDNVGSEFLRLLLDRMPHTSAESQSGSNNPNAWRAVFNCIEVTG